MWVKTNGTGSGYSQQSQPQQSSMRQLKQIFVFKNSKAVFEALDALDAENRKYNKIQLNIVNYGSDPSIFLSHRVDADTMKVIVLEILNGTFTAYTEYKGSAQSNRPDGKPEARMLRIQKKQGQNYPYSITMENGEGEIIGNGAVKMVKKEKTAYVYLSEMDMKRFAVSVLDYIRNFELAQFLQPQK